MAAHPVEEGDGAPSFRPLWMLLPYLWPRQQPELRLRVFASVFFLVLATMATTVSPLFSLSIVNLNASRSSSYPTILFRISGIGRQALMRLEKTAVPGSDIAQDARSPSRAWHDRTAVA